MADPVNRTSVVDVPLDTAPRVESRPRTSPTAPRLRRPYWKSKIGRWALYTTGAVLFVVLCVFSWEYFTSYEYTDDAQVDVHLYPVSARISGYVDRVNVGDNQIVQKGQVIVEIDPKDYEVAVDQARANLAVVEAKARAQNIIVPITSVNTASRLSFTASDVDATSAAIAVAEKQAAAAHAQVIEAEANDTKAQDDLKRYQALVERDEISKQIYDHALAGSRASTAAVLAAEAVEGAADQAVQQARSRLAEAQAQYDSAKTGPEQVANSRAQALSTVAAVQKAKATLEQAELNLEYTKIVAPVSGEVNKNVVVGMNVQAGQQLLTIVPIQNVWITANFKETQLKHIRSGQPVSIDVDTNGRSYKGRIDSIAGATGPLFSLLPPENATGNYVKIVQRIPVKVCLDQGENTDRQLRPGMNVEVKVSLR